MVIVRLLLGENHRLPKPEEIGEIGEAFVIKASFALTVAIVL
jgi:hypothetical protein